MTDAQLNFIYNITNLEKLNLDYFQTNKNFLENRSVRQVSPLPVSSALGTTPLGLGPMGTGPAISVGPLALNDYVRTNRIYCLMLWVYWEGLRADNEKSFDSARDKDDDLKELCGIRNCLAHNDGDVQSYFKYYGSGSQYFTPVQRGYTKGYIQFDNLIFEQIHLVDFTTTIKQKFQTFTGNIFPIL
jgi:hypothetical protein